MDIIQFFSPCFRKQRRDKRYFFEPTARRDLYLALFNGSPVGFLYYSEMRGWLQRNQPPFDMPEHKDQFEEAVICWFYDHEEDPTLSFPPIPVPAIPKTPQRELFRFL